MLGLLSASSSSESLIVNRIKNSLNPFIKEIRPSLFPLVISPCDGEMVEWTLDIFKISPCDGEMVQWKLVLFAVSLCDGEMVKW